MTQRIPKQEKPGPALQDAVLDEARERVAELHREPIGSRTDRSVTPPHGDPQSAHLGRKRSTHITDDETPQMNDEGPGPAEGRTDNRAGG